MKKAFSIRVRVAARTSPLALMTVLAVPAVAQAQQSPAATPAPTPPLTAQAAPADDGAQDIVVTGFRQSLQSALNAKKQAAGVIDAINASDIASFPDANLADSLQRIPGISIERDGGEGRTITVRGLSGDFSRTRLNGLESTIATTGSTLGAGINKGRSFDYSVLASELFNSIVVRKTQSAEIDEGSLGATVDLQTAKPLDLPGFQAAVSAQAAYYDINNDVEPRLAGSISKTFGGGRFGIMISGAYSRRKVQEDAYSNTALADFADVNGGFCPVVPGTFSQFVNPLAGTGNNSNQCTPAAGPNPGSTSSAYNTVNKTGVFVPKLPGYGRFTDDERRLGFAATFQAKVTDTTTITIDGTYAKYDQDQNDLATNPVSLNRANGAAAGGLTALQLAGRPNMKIRDAQVDANGQLVYGVFDGTDFSVANSHNISTTSFYQADFNLEQKFGDRGNLHVLYGQSESVFDNPYSRLVTFSRFDGNGFIYDARQDPQRPILNYGFDATNPNNWQYQNGYDNIREFKNKVINRLHTLKADFKYEFSDKLTMKVGAAFKRFDFISQRQQRIAPTTTIPSLASAGLTISQVSTAPITINSLGLLPGSTNSFIVPDINKIMSAFNVDCYCVNQYGDFRLGSTGTGAQGDNRSVQEQDLSPYIQADFNLPIGLMQLRGDVGVRFAHTHQYSTGFVGTGVPVSVTREYNDWLPALNLALDVTHKLTVRFAAAKVMSRPSLSFLTPGGSVSTANPPFSATVGNPFLDPYRATNIDAAVEWYFLRGAVLSASYFHKNVGSFVQQISSQTTYAAAGLPLNLLSASQDPNSLTTITSYTNTAGGKIDGIELQYQQPFTFLPGFLKHFGTILNYTHIKSNISYILTTNATGPALSAPLVNASPNSANATLYYEDAKFSIRGSFAYRDQYLRSVPLRAGLPDATGSFSTKNVDASASYKLTKHVQLTIDAINLTNQPTSFFDGQTRLDQQIYSSTGRQFFFGARYKF
ncbi:TonB-dependent receptor [Sphingomonas sp. UYEF23]|uniref:TonB-dependent receptor n=1 Tax=Sphingomonas sp. UYEF23 TaxID=1756408 RepID=UPI00339B4314